MVNGAVYGVGIYLSSDPAYSVRYSSRNAGRLLVCAALVGREGGALGDCSRPIDTFFVFSNSAHVRQ